MAEGHLLALERLIVHEGEGVEGEVEIPGDLRDGGGFRIPVDLGIEEIVVEPQLP